MGPRVQIQTVGYSDLRFAQCIIGSVLYRLSREKKGWCSMLMEFRMSISSELVDIKH